MPDLTVTLIQAELAWEDIDANIAFFDDAINAIDVATDLIILPEMFSTGFSMAAADRAEPMDGQAVRWLQDKAAQKGAVITGSVMTRAGEQFFNRLIWARPDGGMETYDKKHLFRYAGEEKVYTPGKKRLTTELKGWRIRPFICYDLRFPAWTRNIDNAYDLSIFVANWPARRAAHWRALLNARAIENQAYVAGVNRVGLDGNGFEYAGHSAVIDPTGRTVFEKENDACTRTIRLEHRILEDYRSQFPAWMDADRDMIIDPPG